MYILCFHWRILPMKIVILEDNKIELEEIKKTINIWSFDQDVHTNISTYHSGEEYFHQNQSFDYDTDLFLLDIEMGDINGITVAEKLRSMDFRGYIIFLTANREYVFEGYNVHAFHFLTKPLNKELFFKCLTEIQTEKVLNVISSMTSQTVSLSAIAISSASLPTDIILRLQHLMRHTLNEPT